MVRLENISKSGEILGNFKKIILNSIKSINLPLISELDIYSEENKGKNDTKRGDNGETNIDGNIYSGILYSNNGSIPRRLIPDPVNLSTSRIASSVTLLQVQGSSHSAVLSNTLFSHAFSQATFWNPIFIYLLPLMSVWN